MTPFYAMEVIAGNLDCRECECKSPLGSGNHFAHGDAESALTKKEGEMRVLLQSAGKPLMLVALKRRLLNEGFDLAENANDNADAIVLLLQIGVYCPASQLKALCRSSSPYVLAAGLTTIALGCRLSWDLIDAGASDVLFAADEDRLQSEIVARLRQGAQIESILNSRWLRDRAIGESAIWRRALRQAVEVGCLSQAACLVLGETGCGKDLIARTIHELDDRRKSQAFIVVDCTTMRPELAGSELFGHARGAFTNAVSARDGAAGLADGGVLFLDEIGELDGPLQAQLLRLIQERVYKRIGEDNWRSSDFRLICATNRDLGEDVRAGRFRQDLYYRITQWQIALPPLRERRSDIPLLVRHFLKENADQKPVELSPELAELLSGMPLIGNVRELRNIVARMKDRQAGCGYLTVGALRDELPTAEDYVPQSSWSEALKAGIEQALGAGLGLDDIGKAAKDMAVEVAMNRVGSNLTHAARLLNVSPRTLQIRKAEEKRRNVPV